MALTLFDKVWNAHTVKTIEGGRTVLYIDRHYIHEVTSPVAFSGIKNRGLNIFRPKQIVATVDHNIPTINQHLPIEDEEGRLQLAMLEENCENHGLTFYGLGHPRQGIIHVIGPELGHTLPGMTIVCGDSHTSTHGAFGAIAFGIGTSEVEMVFAAQSVLQHKPKTMLIEVEGELNDMVEAKDIILHIISKISASGGTGYFIEFAGNTISSLSMEGRMTLCNMSIECGARGGMVAADDVTFDYVKGRPEAPEAEEWDKALSYWKTLHSDEGAEFDKVYKFKAEDIFPQITYGTNPGMGMDIDANIPSTEEMSGSDKLSFEKSLDYMGFKENEKLIGKKVDYIFVGSCTNGRIEDFRKFASIVKGRQKAEDVIVWLVPGSKSVEVQAHEEGLVEIFAEAGFEFREPGCSACLAMNEDKIPSRKYSLSTSNRNFEGRQGQGARTLLCGAAVAAAAAITGVITDPTEFSIKTDK